MESLTPDEIVRLTPPERLALWRLTEQLTIRATESGKTRQERRQDPTVSSYRAWIARLQIVVGQLNRPL